MKKPKILNVKDLVYVSVCDLVTYTNSINKLYRSRKLNVRIITLSITTLFSLCALGQDVKVNDKQKLRGPVWLTHVESTDIVGVSFSFFNSNYSTNMGNNRTFGVRLEPTPFSILEFLFGRPNLSINEDKHNLRIKYPANQQVYGVNISTGTSEDIDIYGVSLTGMVQYYHKTYGLVVGVFSHEIETANGLIIAGGSTNSYKSNGIIVSGMMNSTEYLNGVQLSTYNEITTKGVGFQIGICNVAKNFRGLQIGLWNKNDKRSLPILNWQFKG